jgi:cell division protein FtsX
MIVALIISICIILALGYGIYNMLRKIEEIEEGYDAILERNIKLTQNIKSAHTIITQADVKGSFEADDEIGEAFKTIKSTIDDLEESV